jgi:hypothetical protein
VIDRIVVPTSVHIIVGILLIVVTSIATLIFLLLAKQNRPLNTAAKVSLAATELILLVQVLIGIKLLDQGQGVFQLYVHYLGAILPVGLLITMRWLPIFEKHQVRITAAVMVVTLASVIMTATIGSAFVRGTL